jgi:hypothetical protein
MQLLAIHASLNEHVLRVPATGTTDRQERLTHRSHQSKLGFDGRERLQLQAEMDMMVPRDAMVNN